MVVYLTVGGTTGVRDELQGEFTIARDRILALSEVLPASTYVWRPDAAARSVSEVLVHVAACNFLLLDAIGITAPPDLYFQIAADGPSRRPELIRRNEELERTIRHKDGVVSLLNRSLATVNRCFVLSTDAELHRSFEFLGNETSVRRMHLRLLIHIQENAGQLLAYVRCQGIEPPSPNYG